VNVATSRTVRKVKTQVSRRVAQSKRTVEKKGGAIVKKGRQALETSAKRAQKLVKTKVRKTTGASQDTRLKARKAGAAIGRLLGKAQRVGMNLVKKARTRLT
jgi:hypothetical protein